MRSLIAALLATISCLASQDSYFSAAPLQLVVANAIAIELAIIAAVFLSFFREFLAGSFCLFKALSEEVNPRVIVFYIKG